MNPIDCHYLAGFKPDLSGEYVPRPLIIPAMEYCTADVVDFLIRFGADLSCHYDGEIFTSVASFVCGNFTLMMSNCLSPYSEHGISW